MDIHMLKITELVPYEKNPRKNKEAVKYVAESIKEFGFKQPIIIDKKNVIVCGHTRLEAAKKLKLKEVPCVIADDLTEEQIRAYRLADNKVSEYSEWDFELLDFEIGEMPDIDFSKFGFDFPDIEDEEPKETVNERERTFDAYNLREYDETQTEGKYNMPILLPCNYVPDDLIGFNYALSTDRTDTGIHFYIDDYQFERIWNSPEMYMEKLQKFQCILTLDFSLYTEMPIAMQIWNTYRSRLIGQIAQRYGINVIPTVSWCREESFDFCFDGLPKNATLSISTIGVKREDYNFGLWKAGVDEMIKRLKPKRLLIYGGEVEYDYGKIEVFYYKNHVTDRMKEK